MKKLLVTTALLATFATPGFSQDASAQGNASANANATASTTDAEAFVLQNVQDAEDLAAQLAAQGFDVISQANTLFGRVRITSQSDFAIRETVVGRASGEIIIDRFVALPENPPATPGLADTAGGAMDTARNETGGGNATASAGAEASVGASVSIGG